MHTFELLLSLLAASVGLALLAERLKTPPAIMLTVGGVAIALTPGLPAFDLDPELALALFLPPLLQASAYRTDWRAFRHNLRPILMLAIGAVLFSTVIVAGAAKLAAPGLPWGAAIALGAIVAPPDAVAATAMLRPLRPPPHIVTVLEGESLINDASALVLFRFAVAATAGALHLGQAAGGFVFTAVGGVLVGFLVGRAAMWLFRMLHDTTLDIVVSLLCGFAAYIAAERLSASGVLAAVVCGGVLGTQQHAEFTARTRLDLSAVWSIVEFILTSLVFILIGLQLRGILERLSHAAPWQLAAQAATVAAALIAARFVWVFAWARPRQLLAGGSRRGGWRDATVVSWAGMRGVVSLAAALALPHGFPQRDVIVFLAFCAIVITLGLQGATLGLLLRRLGLAGEDPALAVAAARADVAAEALNVVEQKLDDPELRQAAEELVQEYEARASDARRLGEADESETELAVRRLRLRLETIEAARAKLSEESAELGAEGARALAEELDLEEQQIRNLLERREPPAGRGDERP